MNWITRALGTLLSYCTHPMIQKRGDGNWYCTECGAQVG